MSTQKKIDWPNFTITPNVIYAAVPLMKESELKVVLMVTRETFGWHKVCPDLKVRITLIEMMGLTGLTKPSCIAGIRDGIKRGLLDKEKEGNTYYYFLAMDPPMERVKNLVSEAKARQLKSFTETHGETVKKFNPRHNSKETLKKTGEAREASGGGKNLDASPEGARDPRADSAARALFDVWRDKFNHPNARFTPDREKVAEERLAENSFDDLADLCFDGVLHSDHHMGRDQRSNPKGLVWDQFEWLLKKQSRVEMFIERERKRREKGGAGEQEGTTGGSQRRSSAGGGRGRRDRDAENWESYGELGRE